MMLKKFSIFMLVIALCFMVFRIASPKTEKVVEATEYYTITEHSVDKHTHLVTMKEKDGTEEVVFEIGEDDFNSFGFSENETVPLDVKTKGSSTEYLYNGKQLKESIDKITKVIFVIVVVVIILLLVAAIIIVVTGMYDNPIGAVIYAIAEIICAFLS